MNERSYHGATSRSHGKKEGRKEMVLFNDTDIERLKERETKEGKKCLYLTMQRLIN